MHSSIGSPIGERACGRQRGSPRERLLFQGATPWRGASPGRIQPTTHPPRRPMNRSSDALFAEQNATRREYKAKRTRCLAHGTESFHLAVQDHLVSDLGIHRTVKRRAGFVEERGVAGFVGGCQEGPWCSGSGSRMGDRNQPRRVGVWWHASGSHAPRHGPPVSGSIPHNALGCTQGSGGVTSA